MDFGITMFVTDQTMDPVELAVEVEDRGFHSLWFPEHTHIPTSRLTPAPTGDPELPEYYRRCLDPIVALATAASRTTTLRLGTGVLLVAQREPIVTAKAIATLDHLSGGRVDVGIGFGWNRDEMANHNLEMSTRRDVTSEHVAAMQSIWRHDVASFEGEYVSFTPSWSWPKPAGEIPVLIGGAYGPKMQAALVSYADGWIPIGGSGLSASIPQLHQALQDAGRDPATFRIVPFGTLPNPAKLDHFAQLGVTECVFRLEDGSRDQVLSDLDDLASVISVQ